MNKILQASFSHYQSRRDYILSELDILMNKSSNLGETQKAIDMFNELSQVVSTINLIEQIINDNKSIPSDTRLQELNDLAMILDTKLKENSNQNDVNNNPDNL